MIIDIHAHGLQSGFLQELATNGTFGLSLGDKGEFMMPGYGPLDRGLYDVDLRLDNLARRKVGLQFISPPPRVLSSVDFCADAEFARRLNAQTAAFAAASGGRMQGLAVPALGEPHLIRPELERALDTYGFNGVSIGSAAGSAPLDNPAYRPLFEVCDERRLVVFMHPTTAVKREALGDYTLLQLIGWPTETSISVARMIFAGIFERYPNFNLVLAHGGGTLPYIAGRLDLAYHAKTYEANPRCRENIRKPPSEYLRHMWFDTVVSSGQSLKFLLELVGAQRVVFGSDDPFEIGDPEGERSLPFLRTLPQEAQQRIFYANLQALLDGVRH